MHKNILVMLVSILWSIQAVCGPGFNLDFVITTGEGLKYNLQRTETHIRETPVTLDSEYEAIKGRRKLSSNKKCDKPEILQPINSLARVFPRDVLASIASLLPTVNFISLSRTCTHIYKLCFSEPVLMKHLNRQIKRRYRGEDFSTIYFHHMAFRLMALSDYTDPNCLYYDRWYLMKQRLEEMKKFHKAREGPFHELMVSHINNWPKEAPMYPPIFTINRIKKKENKAEKSRREIKDEIDEIRFKVDILMDEIQEFVDQALNQE